MDAKGTARAHLVGHSMGGATALLLASITPIGCERHPRRTGRARVRDHMAYIEGFIAEKRAKKLRPVLEMLVADPALISKDMSRTS